MLYILTENADAAAELAVQAGGKILKPAFDVMEMGRMAVLQDPTGAVFCVWQPKGPGSGLAAGEPGTLCWAGVIENVCNVIPSGTTGAAEGVTVKAVCIPPA